MSDEKISNNRKQLELNIDYLTKHYSPITFELWEGNGKPLTTDERKQLQELLSDTIKSLNPITESVKVNESTDEEAQHIRDAFTFAVNDVLNNDRDMR